MDRKQFGRLVAALRKEHVDEDGNRLTQIKLAEKIAGIDPQTLLNDIVIGKIDGMLVDVNDYFESITGYSREEVLGGTSADVGLLADPADHDRLIEAFKRDGYIENVEMDFRMKDGSVRKALVSSGILDIGDEQHVLTITRDITEHRRLLKQARLDAEIKQNLLRELNHRVRNNLATLTSLMYLERSQPTQTKEEFISACLTRITSMVELHSILSEQPDKAVEAEQLIRRVTVAIVSGALSPLTKVEFELSAKGLRLSTDTAGGLVMALSELVANVLRHAAPKAEDPELRVCLREVDGLWHLSVSDNGPGLPEGFDSSRDGGTGLKLVRQIARKQLNGDVFIERRANRTVATICFPEPPSTDVAAVTTRRAVRVCEGVE